MILNVHLLHAPDPEDLAHLQLHLNSDIRITTGPDRPVPSDTHILVAGRPRREHLTASPSLRALIVPWAGIPDTTRDLLLDFPHLAVHNLHHNAAATAEMAMALLLSAAKSLVPIDHKLRKGDWTPRYQRPQSIGLEGKTTLILGYGQIGQHVAKACLALGMRVLATRHNPESPLPDGVELHNAAALHRLLPRADALIITLPLTPETKGLIGAEAIGLLPRGAILVNVGRGAIVDEAALYHALRDGALAAAGLDVWYNYPPDEAARTNTPPSNYPFRELDNVVMSPHRAGDAAGIEKQRMAHLATLLNAAARGEPMPNRVDVKRGY